MATRRKATSGGAATNKEDTYRYYSLVGFHSDGSSSGTAYRF